MKSKIISLVAVSSLVLFSALAIADGSHCDSMKGQGPHDMSAESWHQFKNSHSWMFSKDAKDANKHAAPKSDPVQEQPVKPSSDSDSMAI